MGGRVGRYGRTVGLCEGRKVGRQKRKWEGGQVGRKVDSKSAQIAEQVGRKAGGCW